ncbi:helix-turn-helix transcriptional regulator [Streptomyces luteocolor]|uniref:helix-turn-helix transcriptional regulator n=1 Tax=Streptomyces luteocolor TaxID=285500 RepID=UPI000852CD49|nr:helix-turn-helix transcriptional regulator [Streptomyces luteocolor]
MHDDAKGPGTGAAAGTGTGCHCTDTADAPCADGLTRYRAAVVKGCLPRATAPHCLVRLGLLTPPPDDPDVLVPVSPNVAESELLHPIRELLDAQQDRLRSVSSGFSPVHAIYRAARRDAQDWLTVFDGADAVPALLEQAVRECRSELLTIRATDGITVPAGVTHRALFPHAARTHAARWRHLQDIERSGGSVRTLQQPTGRLVVCDRSVAYLVDQGAVEVRHPAVVAHLAAAFDEAWERAQPFSETTAARAHDPLILDEARRAVTKLLVSGLTDDAIARRLGVSRRTVAGHVAAISRELGSQSRAQLGYLIARAEPDL